MKKCNHCDKTINQYDFMIGKRGDEEVIYCLECADYEIRVIYDDNRPKFKFSFGEDERFLELANGGNTIRLWIEEGAVCSPSCEYLSYRDLQYALDNFKGQEHEVLQNFYDYVSNLKWDKDDETYLVWAKPTDPLMKRIIGKETFIDWEEEDE